MNLIEKLGEQSIFLYELYFIYAFMAYKNNFAFTMVIAILSNIVLNMILKMYVIQLGTKYNHKLPIFGSLCRPIDTECKGINMIGYGTPSGHSQIVSFVAAFYYFYYKDTAEFSKGKFGLLLALAIFTMATRYTSSMHSIPQILLGCSIGVGLAYVLNILIHFF
jgi:membrane-associated phospholipid phosphatase